MTEQEQRLDQLAQDVLRLSRNTLLVNLRFLDAALSQFTYHPAPGLLATDGQRIYYDARALLLGYRQEKERPVRDYLHMVLHCVFRHNFVDTLVNLDCWDLACDMAVEAIISELDLRAAAAARQSKQAALLGQVKEAVKDLTAEKIYRYYLDQHLPPEQLARLRRDLCADDHRIWYLPPEQAAALTGYTGGTGPSEAQARDGGGGPSTWGNRGELSQLWKDIAERKYLDRLRKVNARGVLLKYGIQDVPAVHLAEGGALAPPKYLTLCLAEYLKQQSKWSEELCPLADEAAAKLDRQELVQALLSLYEKAAPESNRAAFLPVLFRYADGETMGKLYREYRSMWKMGDFADHALLFSDTREAVIYAEKGNLLRRYAALRKMDEETIRVTKLLNFDLDTAGKKVYDLGEDTVTVVLEPDLTLTLSSANGKAIKSLPKKGLDPEKYESAKADFSEMKKNLKKAVRARFDGLFQDFLSGREMDGAVWAESNLTNPLMRQSASLLVWSQEGKTFTLQGASL